MLRSSCRGKAPGCPTEGPTARARALFRGSKGPGGTCKAQPWLGPRGLAARESLTSPCPLRRPQARRSMFGGQDGGPPPVAAGCGLPGDVRPAACCRLVRGSSAFTPLRTLFKNSASSGRLFWDVVLYTSVFSDRGGGGVYTALTAIGARLSGSPGEEEAGLWGEACPTGHLGAPQGALLAPVSVGSLPPRSLSGSKAGHAGAGASWAPDPPPLQASRLETQLHPSVPWGQE